MCLTAALALRFRARKCLQGQKVDVEEVANHYEVLEGAAVGQKSIRAKWLSGGIFPRFCGSKVDHVAIVLCAARELALAQGSRPCFEAAGVRATLLWSLTTPQQSARDTALTHHCDNSFSDTEPNVGVVTCGR